MVSTTVHDKGPDVFYDAGARYTISSMRLAAVTAALKTLIGNSRVRIPSNEPARRVTFSEFRSALKDKYL